MLRADLIDGQLVKLVHSLVIVGEDASSSRIVCITVRAARQHSVELISFHIVHFHHPLEYSIKSYHSTHKDVCIIRLSLGKLVSLVYSRASCAMMACSSVSSEIIRVAVT